MLAPSCLCSIREDRFCSAPMDELVYMLVNNTDNTLVCEELLEGYYRRPWLYGDFRDQRPPAVLSYFLRTVDNSLFRRLFHMDRDTVYRIAKEVKETKAFNMSPINSYVDPEIVNFVCTSVLYINSCFSIRCCSKFCGVSQEKVDCYINLFNKIMNELKDDVIRFPALDCQNLLRVNSKRFFPGAVGVVGTFLDSSLSLSPRCRHDLYPEAVFVGIFLLQLFRGSSKAGYQSTAGRGTRGQVLQYSHQRERKSEQL